MTKKDNSYRREARRIGNDSFELLNFMQLPSSAATDEQIEALTKDQQWQTDHHNEISSRIDFLIETIGLEEASDRMKANPGIIAKERKNDDESNN